MSERLERVERFEELREGMVVVIKPLLSCACGKHRGMLLGAPADRRIILRPTGRILPATEPRFHLLPVPACVSLDAECITRAPVERGAVFVVLDGLEEPSIETAAASPEEMADVLD